MFYEQRIRILKSNHISLGGGEPTINRYFFEIFSFVDSLDKDITLLTNGRSFASKRFLREFYKVLGHKNNLKIAVPLYGDTPEKHDSITRTPGSFRQTIVGLKFLLRKGLFLELRVVVNQLNLHLLEDIVLFIKKNLKGINRLVFINLKVTGEAFKNRERLIIPNTKAVERVISAVDLAIGGIPEIRLFHFPFCVVPRNYWKFVEGISAPKDQIYFKKECSICKMKQRCPGIWKSYVDIVGDSEFCSIN